MMIRDGNALGVRLWLDTIENDFNQGLVILNTRFRLSLIIIFIFKETTMDLHCYTGPAGMAI